VTPSLKHYPTWIRDDEPIAIPRGRRGVSGQGAVRAVVVAEVLKVGEEVHWFHEISSVSIDHSPTELPQGGLETMASLQSPPLDSSKRVMGLPPLPFTTVQDDPYIAPVLKVQA